MPRASELAQVGLKYLGVPYSSMDCQGFVERCLSDVGIDENLPGSNAWFRKMTWTGTPEECTASFGSIPKGAFLFILKADGKEPEKYKPDGIGNASHVGIYTGMSGKEMCSLSGVANADSFNFGSGAINSSSTHQCVCTSKFSGKSISGGWNRVGLWDRLSYDINFPDGGEKMTATVFAKSGSTVNMRSKPSRSAPLVEQIPVGSTVNVLSYDGEWYYVKWNGKKGYILSDFLVLEDGQSETLTVNRALLESIYSQIGDILKGGSKNA